MTDGRCRFGPRAKREMVARWLSGESARSIARALACSATTVTTARDRWQEASEPQRASGEWCTPRPPVPRSGTAARARVLVIEDDPELATLLAGLLALDGLDVEVSATGEAGLEQALARPPALICLDLDQPGELDCWQVLARLKTNTPTSHVPVIVCTGEQGRGTASMLGATAFLPRAITAEDLREAVARELAAERSSVLVVGDDVALRRLIVETLARDGGELREAADGLEALAMITAQHPDVLVMDLPDTDPDSFDAIERLLGLPETQDLPIIVLTGRDLSASERRFLGERSASLVEKREYSGEQLRRLVHRSPSSVRLRAVNMPFTAEAPTSPTKTRHHAH